MSDKSEYFKGWYEANGEKLNESRRSRYHSDPEYRERVLAQNREARRKKREQAKKERLARKKAQKVRPSNAWKAVDVELGGKIVKMFTIGAVAKALDCSTQALRVWEKKGYIEETPHRSGEKGDRLYTLEQIEEMRASLTEQGRIGPGKQKLNTTPYVERRLLLEGRKRARTTRLYRIGMMAQIAGRTAYTLEQLEQKGFIPETPLRLNEGGHRLYTVGMMKAVKEAFDKRDGEIRGEDEWKAFYSDVETAWNSMGVLGARLVD